jgi:hypothetical protein
VKRALLLAVAALLAPGLAHASTVHLQARESVSLPFPGALAVFAIDDSTVQPTLAHGEVLLRGRRAGETLVTVVLPTGAQNFTVHVAPAPPLVLPGARQARGTGQGHFEIRHDSATQRTATSLSQPFGDGERSLRLHLEALHDPLASEGLELVLPWISLAYHTPQRTIVLLDQRVDESPLTIDSRVLRGLHISAGPLDVHAGVASHQPLADTLVPAQGDRALGLAWRMPLARALLVPRLLWLPDSNTGSQLVTALGLEHRTERLTARGELGWSGGPGASFEWDAHDPDREVWARAAWRPRGFAALSSAAAPGGAGDASWTQKLDERTSASLSGSAALVQLAGGEPRFASGRLDLRRELEGGWSAQGSLGFASYRGATGPQVERRSLAAGFAFEEGRWGMAATLRQHRTTQAGRDGLGARLSLHGALEGWRANVFVDGEQQALTVDALLQGRPDLRRAMVELGLPLGSPEDVLRQLRGNAEVLQSRGLAAGALRVQPMRWQAGGEIAWQGAGAGQPRIGLRLSAARTEAPWSAQDAAFASLSASWQLRPGTELSLGISRWLDRRDGLPAYRDQSLQLALRMSLAGQPFPGEGSRAIEGRVTVEGRTGNDGPAPALAGIEVVLDHGRRTVTDRNGSFVFDRPGAGEHRVEAILPADPGAVFTTPSVLTLAPGAQARFGVAFLPVRFGGVVRNDAGAPVAGVRVRVEGAHRATATTDSNGVYRVAGAEGEVRVTLDPDSLPPGYDLRALAPRRRKLVRDEPASINFSVRAQRSVQGQVTGAGAASARIVVQELQRELRVDENGRFLLRGLPAGSLTLAVKTASGERIYPLMLPDGPAALRDLRLAAP